MAYSVDEPPFSSIDLSKATGLKDLAFEWDSSNPQWVAMTFQTVTKYHRNLQRISLETTWERHGSEGDSDDPSDLEREIGETSHQGWSELDKVLVQLRESQLIRLGVVFNVPTSVRGKRTAFWVERLLPEAMARGIIDLNEQSDGE